MNSRLKTLLVILAVFVPPAASACISGDNVQAIEGNNAVFNIKSTCSKNYTFRYKVDTVDDEAESPGDYASYSGYINFTRYDRDEKVTVTTHVDYICENFEKFTLRIYKLQVQVYNSSGVPRWVTPGNAFYRGTTFPKSVDITGEVLQTAYIDKNGRPQCT